MVELIAEAVNATANATHHERDRAPFQPPDTTRDCQRSERASQHRQERPECGRVVEPQIGVQLMRGDQADDAGHPDEQVRPDQ